ncbi:MAG: Mut7-C RNAse domain-containing protein [Candidatus Bathyarchaeota archaeon]|nr:MAG: Mut7-C RNAse domain-containing protein [Candidatus Bathyarchaeota archaeon]
MKFIADSMLGKLARWLRMLGYNVKYADRLDDKILIEIAKTEDRVLLTRDLELYRQAINQHVQAFLVEEKTEAGRLAALAKRYCLVLELDPNTSRCSKCNAEIRPAEKDAISDRIPSSTKTFYNEFWECTNCEQIYWQGSHWKRISQSLKEAKELLKK